MNKLNKIKIHFVGIGGIGMSGIAELMFDLGYNVQGSDISLNTNIKRLKKRGIKIYNTHKKNNIHNMSAIVISSAIKINNPELQECRRLSIPVITRADMLGELMKLKRSIAIAGSHGKTTTTSLVGSIFDNAKFDPTIVNGGIINSYSNNNRYGKSDWMIVEADESDGSFLRLPHEINIITNIDIEHLDYYKSSQNLFLAFEKFINNLPFYGYSVICTENINTQKIYKRKTIEQVNVMLDLAEEVGIDGVVCSPHELKLLNNRPLLSITPGIRMTESKDDQVRVMKPKEAIKLGANYLVIGRNITESNNPNDILMKINRDFTM